MGYKNTGTKHKGCSKNGTLFQSTEDDDDVRCSGCGGKFSKTSILKKKK